MINMVKHSKDRTDNTVRTDRTHRTDRIGQDKIDKIDKGDVCRFPGCQGECLQGSLGPRGASKRSHGVQGVHLATTLV